jgi:cardiolipin synthase
MDPSLWSREQIYTVQDDYFSDLISAIGAAQSSIEMETYIFEKGVLGDRMCDALCAAAGRGLMVRLLIDGIGSPNFVYDYEPRFRNSGVEVHYYRIWPWIFRHLPGEPRFLLAQFFYRIARLNKGNHRKMCLIDHKALWVGSANVADIHLQEINGPNAWRDLGVRVEGADVILAKQAFDQAFHRGRSLRLKIRLPRLLALSQTYFQRRRRRAAQLRRLKTAKQRVWIETPYFVPLARVVRELIHKHRHGVDVRVLVPKRSDLWVIPWMSFLYLRMLAVRGVKVFEYQPGFSHQKLYLIDDWICLGSTNLNHRSFLHDLEIDVVITHDDNKILLERLFSKDETQSTPFLMERWDSFPFWRKLLYQMFWYFSYWS